MVSSDLETFNYRPSRTSSTRYMMSGHLNGLIDAIITVYLYITSDSFDVLAFRFISWRVLLKMGVRSEQMGTQE
jgi:hypothetical protein